MQINNIKNLNFQNINLNNEKKTGNTQVNYSETKNGIILPDIRSNQILLPNNKIYTLTGSQPVDFNRTGITIKVPDTYTKISQEEETNITKTARRMYKKCDDISEFKNTTTGKKYIRATKNVFDENGVLNSAEVMEINLKKPHKATRYIEDYEHNTVTEIKLSQPLVSRKTITESITTLHKDKNGKVTKIEQYTKSPVKGVYDITETDAQGNKKVLAKTTKNEDGSYTVERHLTSLDGTKTEYNFTADKEGNHKSLFCQITDKNGNVLSTIDRNYNKNGNITTSTLNGNVYSTERNNKGVTITNKTTGESVTMTADDFAATDETKFFLSIATKKRNFSQENYTDTLFDQLPTDTLFTLHNNIKEIIPLEDDLDSAFVGLYDYLMCKTDNFVINHELGHSKDSCRVPKGANLLDKETAQLIKTNVIADTKAFKTAYVEEKAAFIKAFPDYKEKFISYFIESPDTKPQRGRKETVAETNAINGLSPEEPASIAVRTIILQQFFPRSIAEITKLTNPIARAELLINNRQNDVNQQKQE